MEAAAAEEAADEEMRDPRNLSRVRIRRKRRFGGRRIITGEFSDRNKSNHVKVDMTLLLINSDKETSVGSDESRDDGGFRNPDPFLILRIILLFYQEITERQNDNFHRQSVAFFIKELPRSIFKSDLI